jgi:hypothetical protein
LRWESSYPSTPMNRNSIGQFCLKNTACVPTLCTQTRSHASGRSPSHSENWQRSACRSAAKVFVHTRQRSSDSARRRLCRVHQLVRLAVQMHAINCKPPRTSAGASWMHVHPTICSDTKNPAEIRDSQHTRSLRPRHESFFSMRPSKDPCAHESTVQCRHIDGCAAAPEWCCVPVLHAAADAFSCVFRRNSLAADVVQACTARYALGQQRSVERTALCAHCL